MRKVSTSIVMEIPFVSRSLVRTVFWGVRTNRDVRAHIPKARYDREKKVPQEEKLSLT